MFNRQKQHKHRKQNTKNQQTHYVRTNVPAPPQHPICIEPSSLLLLHSKGALAGQLFSSAA